MATIRSPRASAWLLAAFPAALIVACSASDETLGPAGAGGQGASTTTTTTTSSGDPATDDDGDGYSELQGDCDDTAATVHPGAPEVCDDGVDNNCNGATDAAEPDADGDGSGRARATATRPIQR